MIRHLLLNLPVELVLGDLSEPAEHHGNDQGVEILEILVIIWTLGLYASKVVFLLVLISRVGQTT